MTDLEQKAIEAALRKMFAQGHFSICTIDTCLQLLGIAQGGKAYQLLRTLHCVNFADMDRDLAQAVPGLITEVFQGVSLDVAGLARGREAPAAEAEIVEPAPAARRGLLQLFGGR
ncbi:hypothetical protein CF68_33295 [Cupriavidus sp. SK-4]|uniref:hypothetical protein n=1 Tax=Cupriavidus sp. SK-4 TaxID=574750 RepID=UPI000450F6CC|nr:hypothetical protein [Cupriavidus sp. SK-4]EYS89550.1 hypothetical protein CF68_33295 [Cupriavidus sp. SK-4]